MLQKERYMNTLKFQPADRIPLVEWPVREATMREWVNQGYPAGMSTQEFFGLDAGYVSVPVNMGLHPAFTPVVLEQNEKYKIWTDHLGARRQDFLQDATPGFVTRSWLKFPVEDRKDFLEMKKTLRPRCRWKIPLQLAEDRRNNKPEPYRNAPVHTVLILDGKGLDGV